MRAIPFCGAQFTFAGGRISSGGMAGITIRITRLLLDSFVEDAATHTVYAAVLL